MLHPISRVVLTRFITVIVGVLTFLLATHPQTLRGQSEADCAPVTDGLVAWWTADGTTADIIGGHDGIFDGEVYAGGVVGQAFDFDGSRSVIISNAPALNSENSITVEAWVLIRQYPSFAADIVSKEHDADWADRQFLITLSPARTFQPHIGVDGTFRFIQGTIPIATNTWYHVAMTYDGAELKLFVDGQLDVSLSAVGSITQTEFPIRIGGGAPLGLNPYFLNGMVDEVGLFSRALSQEEIQSIHTAGVAGRCLPPPEPECSPDGLVAWWKGDGSANDLIGGHDGNFDGAIYADGVVGQAFDFDGTHSVIISNSPAFNPTHALTVDAWVNVREYPAFASDIISKEGSDADWSDRQLLLTLSPFMTFQPHIGLDGTFHFIPGTIEIETNTWYHVAMTYDGSSLKLFVNGQLDVSLAVAGSIIQTDYPIRIGGGAPPGIAPYYFNGMIDEVGFYTRPLSQAEIHAIFVAGSDGRCSNSLVNNGDFETEDIFAGFLSTGQIYAGWTVEGSVDVVDGRAGLPQWYGAKGNQSIDLSGLPGQSGAIFQDINTSPDQAYLLSFALAGNPIGLPVVKDMRVTWGEQTVDLISFDTTGLSSTNMGWVYYEYIVVATSDLTRLKFESVTSTGYGPVVDDISLIPLPGVMPGIIENPISVSTSLGASVTFSALAEGTAPLRYQWNFNGEPLTGATNSNLTLDDLDYDAAGVYEVSISNDFGSITSEPAVLSLVDLQVYAGVTLAGPIEARYSIQYATSLADPVTWTELTIVTLLNSPQLFIDTTSAGVPKRFYRSILLED